MGTDAQWQPAGPPTAGEDTDTPAIRAAVAKIKADNARRAAERRGNK